MEIRKIIIAAMAAGALAGAAQTPFFRYEPDRVAAIADSVVDSLPVDPATRPAHRQAIKDAFAQLYNKSKQKPATDFNKRISERDSLARLLSEQRDLLKVKTDSVTAMTVVDTVNVAVPEDPEIAAMNAELNGLANEIEAAKKGLEARRVDSKRAAGALAEAQAITDELAAEVAAVSETVAALKGDKDIERLSNARAVADRVDAAVKECSAPLESIDVAGLESVLRDYAANSRLLRDSDPSAADMADKSAKSIGETVGYAGTLQNAVAVMSGKYDADANSKALTAMKVLQKSAPKARKSEIDVIVGELDDRDRAFRNVNFLLNQVADECGDKGNASYDIDEKVTTIVGYFSKDATYPAHYVTFVNAVDNLRSTFRSKTMTGQEVVYYINELKNTL